MYVLVEDGGRILEIPVLHVKPSPLFPFNFFKIQDGCRLIASQRPPRSEQLVQGCLGRSEHEWRDRLFEMETSNGFTLLLCPITLRHNGLRIIPQSLKGAVLGTPP